MKLDTNELYNADYCKRIEAKEWRFRTIPEAMKVLYDHFKPTSVIDVGCANGIHLKAFKDLGVDCLFGIEGTKYWAKYIEKYFDDRYIIKDLREPLSIPRKFDLVISFEVLEHIEREFSTIAVSNICNLGDTLCLTACPETGGFHHLNARPAEYWIKKFEKHGFNYCFDEVEELQGKFQKMRCSGWFKTGLKVFRKYN